ncbi:aminopeptidase N [Amaricoccus sp.]|uniref:aminopeptidase N n=1 Tax=Amaricoccus sp. TaxID=1872485 RepID=UPI001B7029BF|nr:aminopeptidase N [Amaricoccus sp.]MBP7240666.1 aminopeptidase N [Amaricoccus sp.]
MGVDAEARTIRLADYRPPAFLVDAVELTFRLDPAATRVVARASMRPNPARAGDGPQDLRLDGRRLKLVAAAIDGVPLAQNAAAADAEGLVVPAGLLPEGPFTWTCETEIAPGENTALEGLYMSKGMYCTQCEAQGFRKITYWPDRPDVMTRYRVRIEAPAGTPALLSNGNLIAAGEGWAEWEDPFPKPSYLFALVAGDLRAVEDRFTTASGREVLLQIWVRPGDEPRCAYAMDALKRSMKWDEDAYGREYDLDRFMIVAVDDFNMGAMENKGLNVFNSRYVLASPETATDADYAAIERIIAHEYFHNWTGNRITCRDWFQLSLKEGLTVFRDQQFAGDMRSPAVKRIEDVIRLRSAQFREDAGPLAHPVRPEEYVEINNFYTATVYEKGAEVVRMLRTLVGPETWARALDLYFERHDGQAVTIEDWLAVFEDVSGRDLSQFLLWYRQAGTPRVDVAETWENGRYTLRLAQTTPPTPGQPEKRPAPIPIAYGLIGAEGTELAAGLIVLDRAEAQETWDLPERPTPSLLRGFSAPVILARETTAAERARLIAHDADPFNRWEAGRAYALELLTRDATGEAAPPDAGFLDAMTRLADDATLDPAYKALALSLPAQEDVIAQIAMTGAPDPLEVHHARRRLDAALGAALGARLEALLAQNATPGPYSPDAAAAGRRALRARALALVVARDGDPAPAAAQLAAADNMTETMSALSLLVANGAAADALAAFEAKWRGDGLVIDKWFTVQAMLAPPDRAVEAVTALAARSDFDWRNPNRFRALVSAFAAGNPAGFHRADGAGYRFVADWLVRLDPVNPRTTARTAGAFGTWRTFDAGRRSAMGRELERLAAMPGLSRDTGEIVTRLLREEG